MLCPLEVFFRMSSNKVPITRKLTSTGSMACGGRGDGGEDAQAAVVRRVACSARWWSHRPDQTTVSAQNNTCLSAAAASWP